MNMKGKNQTIIAALLLILVAGGCVSCPKRERATVTTIPEKTEAAAATGQPLRKVTVLPYWVPSAQFAGYYVGIDKGFYRNHGIDLKVLPFDPMALPETLIREKKADFALLWLVNALAMKDKGADIANIAQFSSRSSLMLITRKSSGINRIEEMDGKRAGIWIGFDMQPQALFNKYNLKVEMVPIGSTNNLFLQGGVDILNANWFDEYHSVLNCGIHEDELNKFFFADYGFNFLEDGIYCLSEKASADPELCRNFVEAALEGWSYAFGNQQEAIEIVIKFAKAANQPVNRSHQSWMLSRYRELYIPAGTGGINNNLNPADYEAVQKVMLESRFITQPIPYDTFYKPAVR
ncbi:MAG TPA: ABC transporter substrate-binding protein [Bacteroidales bacterium]|nr:ABC transporter substrate-binding protein [Bacteroidales bacterium]